MFACSGAVICHTYCAIWQFHWAYVAVPNRFRNCRELNPRFAVFSEYARFLGQVKPGQDCSYRKFCFFTVCSGKYKISAGHDAVQCSSAQSGSFSKSIVVYLITVIVCLLSILYSQYSLIFMSLLEKIDSRGGLGFPDVVMNHCLGTLHSSFVAAGFFDEINGQIDSRIDAARTEQVAFIIDEPFGLQMDLRIPLGEQEGESSVDGGDCSAQQTGFG
jgi:hypothetical protein